MAGTAHEHVGKAARDEMVSRMSSSEGHMARVLLELYRQWVAEGRPIRGERTAKAT